MSQTPYDNNTKIVNETKKSSFLLQKRRRRAYMFSTSLSTCEDGRKTNSIKTKLYNMAKSLSRVKCFGSPSLSSRHPNSLPPHSPNSPRHSLETSEEFSLTDAFDEDQSRVVQSIQTTEDRAAESFGKGILKFWGKLHGSALRHVGDFRFLNLA
jgi:hypothetical protein